MTRTDPPRRPRSRLRLALLVGLASLVVADQLVLFVGMSDGRLGELRVAPFDPPFFSEHHADLYRRLVVDLEKDPPGQGFLAFDPELGWGIPATQDGGPTFDPAGCRSGPEPLPHERRPGIRRLVCLGDSFTFGAEVGDEECWPYVLDAALDDVEVANLGIGGHGLGQTLLRWRRDGVHFEPDEVWLGWLPGATLRTLSQYRPAYQHRAGTILPKPRFRLDAAGELELVPHPAPSLEATRDLFAVRGRFFEALVGKDYWVSRCPDAYAPTGSRLLHHSALGRLWLTHAERGERETAPWLLDPGTEAYRLTRALVLQTRDEVEATGARFRFLVLPGRFDLSEARRRKGRYWSALVNDLAGEGISVTDLADVLDEARALRRDELWASGGHWSPECNRLVAASLQGLLDPAARR